MAFVRRGRLAEAGATVVGQALSSASNLILQTGLVLTFDPDRFGTMVVALSVYYFVLSLGRATVGDPLVAAGADGTAAAEADHPRSEYPWSGQHWSGQHWSEERWAEGRRRLLVLALAGTVVLMLLAPFVAGTIRPLLLVVAVSLPALLLQDGYRYRAWAERRPQMVVALDGLWLVLVGTGVATAVVVGAATGAGAGFVGSIVVLAWVMGGWCSAAVGHRLTATPTPAGPAPAGRPRRRPASGPSASVSSAIQSRSRSSAAATNGTPPLPLDAGAGAENGLRAHRSLSASQVLLAVDSQALPPALAAVAGPAAGGGMRAAVLPFLPVSTALGALRVWALPRLRRQATDGDIVRATAHTAAAFAAVAIAMTVPTLLVLQAVPPSWLGPTGRTIAPWFAAGAVIVAGRMVSLVPADAVALSAGARVAVRHRLTTSGLDWAAALGGLALGGLGAAFWARAVAVWCGVLWWSIALHRHRRPPPKADERSASGGPKVENPLAVTHRP